MENMVEKTVKTTEEGFSTSFAGKRVLATGASGFFGANLVRKMLELDADVHALYFSTNRKIENLSVKSVKVDLRDLDALKKVMKTIEPEIVFHLAASGVNQSADIQTAININVIGTVNLLQSLLGSKIERFLHTGTCHEYGDIKGKISETAPLAPRSIYAGTKAASTAICLTYHYQYGFPITILRPFVAYGPFANAYTIISTVILNALRGENVPLSSGLQKRDFVYIGDVVDAYAKAAAKKANGEIINVGSGVEWSIKEVVTKTLDLMGAPVAPLFGALPDRKGEIWHLQADNSKAKKILDWKPKTSLKEGLKRTIKWFKANKHFYGNSAHE